jgi:hypothetical protein
MVAGELSKGGHARLSPRYVPRTLATRRMSKKNASAPPGGDPAGRTRLIHPVAIRHTVCADSCQA